MFNFVPGYAGVQRNKWADRLARLATSIASDKILKDQTDTVNIHMEVVKTKKFLIHGVASNSLE